MLQNVPILAGLDEAALTMLWERAVESKIPAGGVIVREGETGNRFFLVAEGSVRVCRSFGQADEVELAELGARAVGDPGYRPDVALVNFYDQAAKMGMHQDKDERSDAPVVSLSIGDSCVFRFGNTEHRNRPWTDVELRSGDLFVFGGPSRFAYHGVTKTWPGTGDPATGLAAGRVNITLRVSGLD